MTEQLTEYFPIIPNILFLVHISFPIIFRYTHRTVIALERLVEIALEIAYLKPSSAEKFNNFHAELYLNY